MTTRVPQAHATSTMSPHDRPPDRNSRSGRRRAARWAADFALVALVFFGLQMFLTRDVARGPLPPLDGLLADGAAFASEPWRAAHGDAVVLYVWATWCPICKTVEGNVDAVARDAAVLTVALQSGGGVEVGRFLDARGYRWKTLLDDDARVSGQLGVHAVPTLLFVDRGGTIRAVTQGYTSEVGIRLRLWWARRFA